MNKFSKVAKRKKESHKYLKASKKSPIFFLRKTKRSKIKVQPNQQFSEVSVTLSQPVGTSLPRQEVPFSKQSQKMEKIHYLEIKVVYFLQQGMQRKKIKIYKKMIMNKTKRVMMSPYKLKTKRILQNQQETINMKNQISYSKKQH